MGAGRRVSDHPAGPSPSSPNWYHRWRPQPGGAPAHLVTVPVLVVPSPQSIVAVKSLAVALGSADLGGLTVNEATINDVFPSPVTALTSCPWAVMPRDGDSRPSGSR